MNRFRYMRRVWDLYGPYHKAILGILALILLFQTVAVIAPIYLGRVIASVARKDAHGFSVAIVTWLAIVLVRGAIYYIKERYELKHLNFEISRHMSRISMEKFFSISMGQHHLGHSLIKSSIINRGEAAVTGTINQAVYELIPITVTVALPIIMLLMTAWQVGVCALLSIAIFSTYTVFYNLRFVPQMRSLETLGNQTSKKQGEIIANADVVIVNAQEERAKMECDSEKERVSDKAIPMWINYISWFYSGQWIISFSQAGCMAVGGYLAFNGKLSAEMFVTVYIWIINSLGVLSNISHIQRSLARNIGPIIKYFKFLDYEPDIVMPVKPVPLEGLQGRIEFRNVSFTYRSRTDKDSLNDDDGNVSSKPNAEKSPEEPAIKDLSFVLEAGKRYAFVGPSGAGKSTLVGLILRAFDPQGGHVLIDGIDIRMLDYRELRRNIGLVPQDVSLFDGSVRYNITFGMNGSADKVTDADLDEVAKLARISEFADKLENRWDTLIGERGIKLSGGQRQRVGIARALIKDPRILIFDEATSSLDTENEAGIRESIREASTGKTTIIIAHRLATVRDADMIFVFDRGQLVGQGSHDELLATNEAYQRLVHNQVIMA